jgi:hypothetical protein
VFDYCSSTKFIAIKFPVVDGVESSIDGCWGIDEEEDKNRDKNPCETISGSGKVARTRVSLVAAHRGDMVPASVSRVMRDCLQG